MGIKFVLKNIILFDWKKLATESKIRSKAKTAILLFKKVMTDWYTIDHTGQLCY